MKWSTAFIVDGIDRRVVVQEDLHARCALGVVCIADTVVEWRQTARVLVVCRRTESQQRLHMSSRLEYGVGFNV